MPADIVPVKYEVLCMPLLIPAVEIAQVILIVVVQNVSLEVREIGNAPDAYSMRVKVVILKKRRTLLLCGSRVPPDSSHGCMICPSPCPSICGG